jgi:hypothetical protein
MAFLKGGFITASVPEHEERMCEGCGTLMNGSDEVNVGTARPGLPDVTFVHRKTGVTFCEDCWLQFIGEVEQVDGVGPKSHDPDFIKPELL